MIIYMEDVWENVRIDNSPELEYAEVMRRIDLVEELEFITDKDVLPWEDLAALEECDDPEKCFLWNG